MEKEKFFPLYFAEKLRIINPFGIIGVVTLWSSVDWVIGKFKNGGIDLGKETSKIAVLGTLYGEGFKYLLRNLLYNPQIKALLVFGRDRNQSYRYLVNFFNKGVEQFEANVEYISTLGQKDIKSVRIIETNYIMDDLIQPGVFATPPIIKRIENIDLVAVQEASEFVCNFEANGVVGKRIAIEVPDVKTIFYPSNLRSHTIVDEVPSKAWKSLIHRIFRFGKKVALKKGERIELQNVKVVIESPQWEDAATILECGFDPENFNNYQRLILSGEMPQDTSYTYGNRLRAYFGVDCLEKVTEKLKEELDDRSAFISLWDNRKDLTSKEKPCLVSLFFRKICNKIYLTATFRTHNAGNAWLENIYGLMAIQEYVANSVKSGIGPITIISLSISLDPQTLEKAKNIHDRVARENIFKEDPNGYFLITTSECNIILKHMYKGQVIGEYRGENPIKIQNELYRNNAISDVNHAIYIGRQLERAYRCIQENISYLQED